MDIKKFGLFFLLGIILVITFKFLIIIEVFFPAITAACVLAYLFNPVYLYFLKIIKKKSLSALLVIFIIIVLGLIPITIIVSALQDQIVNLFKEETIANFRATLQSFENFVNNQFNIQISGYFPKDPADFIPGIISTAQDAIAAFGPGMIYSITGFLFSTFVTFFIMFYLLKNSKNVLHTIKSYFPLTIKNCDILLREMGKDTKALILGQVLIAAMQGTFGAIGFFIFGISGAILWGFVMMIVSFLPFLGTVLVWFPAVVALALKGAYWSSLGLFIWGSTLVGASDNFVRPKLTSSLGQIHPVTVLLGIVIGIKEWGVIGLVLGPLIISVLIILIKMFREEYIEE